MKEMATREPAAPPPAPEPAQVPARPDDFNPWLDPSNAGETSFGALMFYRQGKWCIGEEEVPLGSQFIAYMPEARRGWIRFKDGKPVEPRLDYCRDCKPVPERDTLGDDNPDEWETDDDNRPVDPWNKRHYLPLEDVETGEVVTWAFWSDGGVKAYNKLCRTYAPVFKTSKLPIISLQTDSYYNKKHHRDTSIPVLKFVRWHDCGPAAQGTAEIIPPDASPPASPPKTYSPDRIMTGGPPKRDAEMDDSIPF